MTTSFNFDSIDTPAELAKENDKVQSPLGQAMEAMEEVGFQGSMLMVIWLLNNMSEFHQDVALDKAEGRRMVASWAYDQGKLDSCLAILRTIDFGQNQSDDDSDEEETEA